MERDQQKREDQRLPNHDPGQRLARLSSPQFKRFSDQDDLAEDEGVDERETLLPDADPVPLHQLPVQAEERKKNLEIHADDRVFLKFADRAVLQAFLGRRLGGSRGRVRQVLHDFSLHVALRRER
jgi:hypothetical protein